MLTPATITVNFTANYAGPHRICWRQCGIGAYVCTNIVDCAGGGNVCSAVVSIMVDPESCTPVCFEGYIQATCNPEGSPTDQVLWSASFVPTPTCNLYQISCTNGLGCVSIPSVNMGLNCNGTPRPAVGPFAPATDPIMLCAQTVIPGLPADISMTLVSNNCCDCNEYTINITPAPILDGTSLYYVDCVTKELVRIDYTGNVPVLFNQCAIAGSPVLHLGSQATGGVIALGVCP